MKAVKIQTCKYNLLKENLNFSLGKISKGHDNYYIDALSLQQIMDINQQSKLQGGIQNGYPLTPYDQLKKQYSITGITYKSNEVLHKISQIKGYPYALLLEAAKMFHMNQFQVIFFSHILNDEECSYQADPAIFETGMNLPQLTKIYNRLTRNGQIQLKVTRIPLKGEQQQQDEQEVVEQNEAEVQYWTLAQLRKLYVYLLVIGYSIKYYLNQSIKPYEDEVKRRHPDFFTSIFNVWVDKYSNKVLRTNPRKINQFYIDLFIGDEITAVDNSQLDCQYRNYNEIVEELIKATSDGDEGIHEEDKDYGTYN